MKQLTVGIFHDENLGKELGKKATESDMVLYHRKFDDIILSFVHPLNDKLTVKTQVLGIIDIAIVSANTINYSLGETILLLDAMNINHGFILVPPYSDTTQIKKMIQNTTLNNYEIMDKDIHLLLQRLQELNIERKNNKPVMVTIDHAFPVKGIGEVILGFIQQGTIHSHDKVLLLPSNKEVIVRSIQMQDKDVSEAGAGSRVGLAVKGAKIDELERGAMLCEMGSINSSQQTTVNFKKNPFYPKIPKGKYHVTVGMQSLPISINEINEESIQFSSDKPFCFNSDSRFLFLNLNAEKLHFMGSGLPQ